MKVFLAMLFTALLSMSAVAERGGEGNNTGCNGRGNPNSPCEQGGGPTPQGNPTTTNVPVTIDLSPRQAQLQGQLQGQQQGQVLNNANDVQSNSSSTSNADSRSAASATGGSVRNSVANAAVAGAAGGEGGDSISNITIDGDDYDPVANTAAAVYAQTCQTGGSGQVEAGGFGVVNTDPLCDYYKTAAIMYAAYERELANGAAGQCTTVENGQVRDGDAIIIEWQEVCELPGMAQEYLDAYYKNMHSALDLVDDTEALAKADRMAGFSIRPIAVLAALVFLL